MFRRLRDDCITGSQGGTYLSHENSEREVPGTNADKDASSVETKRVEFSGRTWKFYCVGKVLLRLLCVVAAEIYRFTYFRERVLEGSACLGYDDSHQFRYLRLQ